MNNSVHLVADLYDCDYVNKGFLSSSDSVKQIMNQIEKFINDKNLHVLNHIHHIFGKDAVTASFLLAESHVNFHTWPEYNYVSVDVFVCNYSNDNTKAVYDILDYLVEEIFFSKKVKKKEIIREIHS